MTKALHAGSALNLTIVDNKIVLDPVGEKANLEKLLADSPRDRFRILEEDRVWLNAKPVGKEV